MDKQLKKNILKGSAATSIGTISGMVFQFLTVMILARYVTKDDLGIYVLVIVVSGMLNLLGGLGLGLTMVKYIASNIIEEKEDVLFPVLLIRAFGCLLFGVLFLLLGRHITQIFNENLYNYAWYIIAIFILANFRDLFYNLMQGLKLFKQYSIVNVTSSVFRVLVILPFLILNKLDIQNLLIIEILATFQPVFHQLLVIPFNKYLRVKPTTKSFKKVINFSIPLYLNNLVDFINNQMNIFIIGAYLNPAGVANYDIARKVPQALKKIFSSYMVVYFPNLAALFSNKDKKEAVNLIEKSISIFSITAILLFLFSFLFRNKLTLLLFSARYEEVSLGFALLILNFFVDRLGNLMGFPFLPAGHPSVPTWVNAVGSVISIGLSLLLVPIYGYMGAIYALLIMNPILAFLYYLFMLRYKINPAIKSFLKPVPLVLIAVVSLIFNTQSNLLINSLLFIFSVVLGWLISEDFRSTLKTLVLYVHKFIQRKNR